MATGDLMRVIQLETNKLYQFETRMQSSIEERQKTLQSLKNHGEVVQNQFFQSRQLESSKDEVNEGEKVVLITFRFQVYVLFRRETKLILCLSVLCI